MDVTLIVVVVVATALIFDFTNGFHDTANAMATSIATGALSPKTAVTIAGVLNLVGAFLSVEVAKTISSGMVDEAQIGPVVISPIRAGVVALVATYLAYRITARADDGTVTRGFKIG
jgi:phosphate/sulfate permease